ncbi:MAG: DUF1460 domain-containing protein [Saprospiraceae bacterium]|nr:DUF1460 domain-containing protein [Saprospiraceae bacterium]
MLKVQVSLTLLCLLCATALSAQQTKPKPQQKPTPSVKSAPTGPKTKSPNQRIYENALQEVGVTATLAENFTDMSKHFMGHDAYLIRAGNDAVADDNGRVRLQKPGREVLFIDLEIFDCQTFIEYSLALTQTKRMSSPSYEDFRDNMRRLRYRNGTVNYGARMHYFSDWIYEHQRRGLLKDVSREIGGETYIKDVHYMSTKKDTFYGNMAEPQTFATVRQVEKNLSAREKYYIPKDKLASVESGIKDGDILAITNATDGMDVAHCGVAYWQGTRLHLLHASSELGFVIVTNEPLSEYLANHQRHTGIMVARLLN